MTTQNAIGYVRVSTQEQANSGAGLAAQRRAIREEVARRGWTLVRIEEDRGVSAKSTNGRDGLARALAAVEDGTAGALVVSKLDRLVRSMSDFVALLERSRKKGWALVSLDLGLDTATPMGEFSAHIIASVAQLERRLIGQRTREAMSEKKAEGRIFGRPTTLPPEVIARIVAERQAGRSLPVIAAGLDADGIPTSQGGVRWWPSTVLSVLRRAGV